MVVVKRITVVWWVALVASQSLAVDPPHITTNGCNACHITHNAPGAAITDTAGNPNLCMSCHTAGGTATRKPFTDSNQALPWPGLPTGTNVAGTSHRWDAAAAGHLSYLRGATTNSTGAIIPSGVYTGFYPKTYTIIISNSGNVGTARFNWTATYPDGGAGTNILTAASVALNLGITLNFYNGTGTSFQAQDKWNLYVRTDLRNPTNTVLLSRMTNSVVYCSTCHDQHSQTNTPFDVNAPAYVAGVTSNRHFMRINNDLHQMCNDCHAARVVTNSVFGSHPVGLTITTNAYYKLPTSILPLEKTTSNVVCLTCHQMHFASATNGMILRLTNTVALCVNCHTLADTNSPAAHLVSTNANLLWPGGQYGSLLTNRTDTTLRGSCLNCHMVHGWADAANPTNHYPTLLADREENLCYTCHDADGPAVKRVKANFDLKYRHPVVNTDPWRFPGRTVECKDCHQVHDALANSHVYTNTATATRNLVSNPLKGVSGVALSTNSLANFQIIHSSLYSLMTETNGGATYEYQVCFKCHSGYSFRTNNTGTATFTTNSTTVTGSGTTWTNTMAGMWIARTGDTRMYTITNVASATSLTIRPAFGSATVSTNFTIWNIPAGLTAIYTNGTASFTTNSTTVTGTGTGWTNTMIVGLWIYPTNNPAAARRIIATPSATNLTIYPAYPGATASAQAYAISGGTDVAQEFSPMNRSGHPIFTGLTNYPNSVAPKALTTAAMKSPWNVSTNMGRQTMMCSDCHDSTTTNYVASAAQGPHGSANQFLLRGPNAANWPNVTLANRNTAWCANCHNSVNNVHSTGNHSSRYCYECHIIIPHGGKISRLMGDRDTMPPRYAWNNTLTNMQNTQFRKTNSTNYAKGSTGNCSAACATSDHPNITGGENW
jgi:predicted CXXCH cytochrome family protein